MNVLPNFQPLVDAAAFWLRMRGVVEIVSGPFWVAVFAAAIYSAWRLVRFIAMSGPDETKKTAAKKREGA